MHSKTMNHKGHEGSRRKSRRNPRRKSRFLRVLRVLGGEGFANYPDSIFLTGFLTRPDYLLIVLTRY